MRKFRKYVQTLRGKELKGSEGTRGMLIIFLTKECVRKFNKLIRNKYRNKV